MNKQKLLSVMLNHGDTVKDIAKALGINVCTFSVKTNGYKGAEFTQSEIAIIKKRYKLTPKQIDEIFFAF